MEYDEYKIVQSVWRLYALMWDSAADENDMEGFRSVVFQVRSEPAPCVRACGRPATCVGPAPGQPPRRR